MVNSTVEWASNGFDGNPAYLIDPEQYFTDLADGIVGNYIENDKNLSFLCSPFQLQVRLALRRQYVQPDNNIFQCTLSGVASNIENYYENFNDGGWDAWFAMTQNPQNNPYGALINAELDINSKLVQRINKKSQQLEWDKGFLAWEECPAGTREESLPGSDPSNPLKTGECIGTDQNLNPYKVRKVTKTPGSVIGEQLNNALPANMNRYINAQHLEDLVGAFVTGALNRYVFGSQGLFGKGPGANAVNPNTGNNPTQSYPTPAPPTYEQCVQSCTAAAENGINTDSCISLSCSLLLPDQQNDNEN
jgi:hypothetical protein